MKNRQKKTLHPEILSPGIQTSLQDVFTPPEGCKLTHALITSYSIDLDVVIALLCNMAGQGALDEYLAGSSPIPNQQETNNQQPDFDWRKHLLARVKSLKGNVAFVFEAGRVQSRASSNIHSLLPAFLFQVHPEQDKSFHPKFSLLRFQNVNDGGVTYRLLCSSRNLTRTPMWELLFSIDGKLHPNLPSGGSSQGKELKSFINRIVSSVSKPDQISYVVRKLSKEISRVAFPVDHQFNQDWDFVPMFPGHKIPNIFAGIENPNRGLIISPFVDEPLISKVSNGLKKHKSESCDVIGGRSHQNAALQVICRPEEAPKISSLADDKVVIRVFKPNQDAHLDETDPLNQDGDLHAKLYLIENDRSTCIWLGSANATSRAWGGRNTEVMVRLRYRGIGLIDALVDSLSSRLGSFLESEKTEELSEEEGYKHLVDLLRRCKFTGSLNGNDLQITVQGFSFGIPPSQTPPSLFRGKKEYTLCTRLHACGPGMGENDAQFRVVCEDGRFQNITQSAVIRSVTALPSPILFCWLKIDGKDSKFRFSTIMEFKAYDFDETYKYCYENLTTEDWGTLLWSILGESIAIARNRARPGHRNGHGKQNQVKRGREIDGRPLMEDVLYSCVSDPSRIELLQRFVHGNPIGDAYVDMVAGLLKALTTADQSLEGNMIARPLRG